MIIFEFFAVRRLDSVVCTHNYTYNNDNTFHVLKMFHEIFAFLLLKTSFICLKIVICLQKPLYIYSLWFMFISSLELPKMI